MELKNHYLSGSIFPLMRIRWKRVLPKIHVYGGLLASGFLLLMAFSAFVHQHHPKFMEYEGKQSSREQEIEMPEIAEKWTYKAAVRDSLGLFGYTPWWEDYRDSLGVHHFMITRPGKKYWVTVPLEGNLYKVTTIRTGLHNVLNQLHPLSSGMRGHGFGPAFIGIWKCVALALGIVSLIAVLITLYYWLTRSVKKKHWWYFIAGAALIPVLLFIMIWLVG